MASTTDTSSSLEKLMMLSDEQQRQLLQAFTQQNQNVQTLSPPNSNSLSLSPSSFSGSPHQTQGYSNSTQESPFLDNYDYSFADSSFGFDASQDFSGAAMIGDIPQTTARSDSTENEGNDKRAHPADEEDDEETRNTAKRRESTEKVPKKPGRKPITSEPTSKRKAQNRAAQRAFRERKEKHLKDLEDKVVELEKKSQEANTENTQLRAQLESVTAELNEYKKKVQSSNGRSFSSSSRNNYFGNPAINNLSDVNFQFEFPKFGTLPGPPLTSSNSKPSRQASSASTPQPANAINPQSKAHDSRKNTGATPSSIDSFTKADLANLSSIFSSPSNVDGLANGNSRASTDSAPMSVGAANTSSPSGSSNSTAGLSSSCGTSPEPLNQSPLGFKPLDTMTTIGEMQPAVTHNGTTINHFDDFGLTSNNFDWLAQQNGGQFDPQLFGNYRDPQEHILSNPNFEELINESLDADFFTPYNIPPTMPLANSKKSLIQQIDAKQNADDDMTTKSEKGLNENCPQTINCREMWDKLQNCPQAKDIDLDSLCTELQKKAKCSGNGPVIQDRDFNDVLSKYLGKDLAKACKDKPMYP